MITPHVINHALSGDPRAMTLLRAAIDSAARPTITAILALHTRELKDVPPQSTVSLLLQKVFDAFWDRNEELLRTWNGAPPFVDEVVKITTSIVTAWCLARIIVLAIAGNRLAGMHLSKAFDRAARPVFVMLLGKRYPGPNIDLETKTNDLCQELFKKLWERGGNGFLQWDWSQGPFDAYFRRAARNYVIDKARLKSDKPLHDDIDSLPELVDGAPGPDELTVLEDLLRKALPIMQAQLTTPEQRKMFVLIILQGQKPNAICQLTGLSRNAVDQWRRKFKVMLKNILEELSSDPEPPNRNGSGKAKK
jgi:RNA polymerase sigma factor (sigma-70 family)